ncbi:MAG: hypothetical protein H7843_05605 [Nitrospirota bacterium]
MSKIENYGSAIGEAIGSQMEHALNTYLTGLVCQYDCRLISTGQKNPKTGKVTKLYLYDTYGTAYNIDSVITNESMQPLILIEYKYIRYKKHNRDKGSWLCTAHNAIRRRYNSIRSSIAVLAGSWSKSSVAMMTSHDINIFIIPFDTITELLKKHNIEFDWGEKDFDWGEKDRDIAAESWEKYSLLSDKQKLEIAENMIAVVKDDLEITIAKILDNATKRGVERVTIEIHTNIGEVKRFEFDGIQAALNFLEDFSFEEILNNADSFTLFDTPDITDLD